MSAELVAVAALAIWLYLLLGRGSFWRSAERDDSLAAAAAGVAAWPSVTAIIPARNEADVIAESLASLFRQDYPGPLSVIVVDDQSTDSTAHVAWAAAKGVGASDRLTIVTGSEPPPGWTGKLFAMHQGVERATAGARAPDFLLFTDADIAYTAKDALRVLVAGALAKKSVLTSVMVKLRCESVPERLLIPAFVFFFQMLYPFAWVNETKRRTAAAAGGCMLVHREALARTGGLKMIRSALIDDCALGALLKKDCPIWLGLTERVVSLRPYPHFDDIRRMVVRSAFAELRYSPWRLAGTLAGMVLTYLAPPLLVLFGSGIAQALGAAAWLAMAVAFIPTLRLYGRSPFWGIALPLIAAIYTGFTLESAIQHWRGRGGAWKGRFQTTMAAGHHPLPSGERSAVKRPGEGEAEDFSHTPSPSPLPAGERNANRKGDGTAVKALRA